jgi:hypothetical protein
LILFSFSCKKETPASYVQFPMELTTTEVSTGTKLTWTKIETSDFIDYTIVRSTTDSIPDLSKLATNPNALVITRLTDPQITSFTDPRFSTQQGRTYYRVFARLSGRNVSSRNVLLNADVLDLSANFSEIITNNSKDKPRFFLVGSNTSLLVAYDANDDRILATGALPIFISNMRLAVASKNDANEEVVAYSANLSSVSFFDATTLKSTSSVNIFGSALVMAAYGTTDGFFIFITNETTNNVKVVSTISHAIISQATINFTYTPPSNSVLTKNPAQRELILRDPITFSSVRLSRLQYTEQGQVTDGGLMGTGSTNSTASTPILRVSTNGDLLLVNSFLFTRSFANKANFSPPNGSSYADFSFSPQSDKIYAFVLGSSLASNLDEYDGATFKLIRSIPTKLSGFRCFSMGNSVIVFSNGNFTGRTSVQKVKI